MTRDEDYADRLLLMIETERKLMDAVNSLDELGYDALAETVTDVVRAVSLGRRMMRDVVGVFE